MHEIYNFLAETKPTLPSELEAGRLCTDSLEFDQLAWADSVYYQDVTEIDYFDGDAKLKTDYQTMVKHAGLTYLKRQHAAYMIQSQCVKRLAKFTQILQHHHGKDAVLSLDTADKLSDVYPDFSAHFQILTGVLDRLVITNTIDHPLICGLAAVWRS